MKTKRLSLRERMGGIDVSEAEAAEARAKTAARNAGDAQSSSRKFGKRTGRPLMSLRETTKLVRELKSREVARKSGGKNTDDYSYGYTVKDIVADKSDYIMAIIGRICIGIVILGGVIFIGTFFFGVIFYPDVSASSPTGQLLERIAMTSILGGIAGPVLLLWYIGVPVSTVIGMQMISRWGFLASVPFAIWTPVGSWPLIANFANESLDMNLPTWEFSLPVYLLGLGFCAVFMILIGAMSGVSMNSRAEQMAERHRRIKPLSEDELAKKDAEIREFNTESRIEFDKKFDNNKGGK